MMKIRDEATVLVLGTADWDQPIATNQHYVVRELCQQFDVIYVESMGLRRPQVSREDIRRIKRRLLPKSGLSSEGQREVPHRLQILTPKVLPLHRGLSAIINRAMIRRQIRPWLTSGTTKVLWTYTPVTYGLENEADSSIYHCVDLLREVSGVDSLVVDSNEQRLAATAIQAIGSSERVVSHLTDVGFSNVRYWPNVADISVFESNNSSARSGVLFAGNLTTNKVDFSLLQNLVERGVELHLAGPIADSNAERTVKLLADKGAKYHGMLDLQSLSTLAGQCKVGLIPYVMNSYTKGVSPLKTYEYLAAGLTVISTDLPGVQGDEPSVFIAKTQVQFIDTVIQAVTNPIDHLANVARCGGHGWLERGLQVRRLVSGGLER